MDQRTHDVIEETVKLTAADGHSFEAFHAKPKQGSKGGLVILQEIFGLTDQLKSVVRSYAADGYDTIFPCVYDRVATRGGRSGPARCRRLLRHAVADLSQPEAEVRVAVPLRQDRSQLDPGDHRASAQGLPVGRNLYLRSRSRLRQQCEAGLCRSRGQDRTRQTKGHSLTVALVLRCFNWH
jgi:dienelactone hydrolase